MEAKKSPPPAGRSRVLISHSNLNVMLKFEGSNPGLAVYFLQNKLQSLNKKDFLCDRNLITKKNHKPSFQWETESSEIDRLNYFQHIYPILGKWTDGFSANWRPSHTSVMNPHVVQKKVA